MNTINKLQSFFKKYKIQELYNMTHKILETTVDDAITNDIIDDVCKSGTILSMFKIITEKQPDLLCELFDVLSSDDN